MSTTTRRRKTTQPILIPDIGEFPALGEDTIIPRRYQADAIEAARRELSKHRSTLIVHATGLGKTAVAAKIARMVAEKGKRTLFVAHRKELIDQAEKTCDKAGLVIGIEKAESYARSICEPHLVIGSVQSMQRARLKLWPRDYFALVIVDECHHATAGSYREILTYFNSAKVVGVTATPDRADEECIGTVFASVAHEMTLYDAITAPPPGPYLSRLTVVQCGVEIDLKSIRTTGGDYNVADLEERIGPKIDTLANAAKQEIGDRPTIVFTPDVGSAQAMASAMASIGLAADWVSGDRKDRDEVIQSYHDGRVQVLCNCQILTEGFDAPKTAAIVLCRPTKSRSLYAQMVGRGTRLYPGKRDVILVDFNYLTAEHELVRPADLFQRMDDPLETVDIAGEMIQDGQPVDLLDVVEKARATQRERQILRIMAREKKVQYRRVSYDPLSLADALGLGYVANPATAEAKPATPQQIKYLNSFGVEGADKLSQRIVGRMLNDLAMRRHHKLATPKQVAWLIAKGVEPGTARTMTKADATKSLDMLFSDARAERRIDR